MRESEKSKESRLFYCKRKRPKGELQKKKRNQKSGSLCFKQAEIEEERKNLSSSGQREKENNSERGSTQKVRKQLKNKTAYGQKTSEGRV